MATEQRPLTPAEERELKALEAGLAGKPVDADLADFADLAATLNSIRPEPDPLFAAELDQAVADSFPPEWSADTSRRPGRSFFDRLAARFGEGRQAMLPLATGLAGLLIVVVAAGIAFSDGQPGSGPSVDGVPNGRTADSTADEPMSAMSAGAAVSPDTAGPVQEQALGRAAAGADRRLVANSVRITLATTPEDLQETSNRIVEVADSYNGIVMRSSVTDGDGGNAGARFTLMIPTGKAEAAVADLSAVADLRSRSQGTVDITAPTLSTRDRLRTTRARVESLLGELADASSDEERAIVERKLSNARREVAWLTTSLKRLERRAALTPVNVTVETDQSPGSGSGWDIGDAIGDAGRLLAVSAGVAVIALAVAIPIGLMLLIALAINRAWVRRSRERALRED